MFVEFVGTANPRINNLHELINWGYKVIFIFVGINKGIHEITSPRTCKI